MKKKINHRIFTKRAPCVRITMLCTQKRRYVCKSKSIFGKWEQNHIKSQIHGEGRKCTNRLKKTKTGNQEEQL